MKIIRAADFRRMPWKNGGGETIEVAVSPAGAPLGSFDWRLSMARVAADGPFSVFPGVDRTLVVLTGGGIILTIGGQGSWQLRPESEPFSFPGDAAVDAKLIAGPIDDLNLMTRRELLRHQLTRKRIVLSTKLTRRSETVILTRDGSVTMDCAGSVAALATGDAIHFDDHDAQEIAVTPDGPVELLIADVWRG